MRKVRLFIAASLDGFIAREDGSIDWLFSDADYGYAQFYDSVDAVLVGRRTYEQAKGFEQKPFSGKKVYVFTRSLTGKGDDGGGGNMPPQTPRDLQKSWPWCRASTSGSSAAPR
jgi:dihydrofolate reductase